MMSDQSILQSRLAGEGFVVTAEFAPKLTASAADLIAAAMPLKGKADAVNVTDAAGARVGVSSLAVAALLAREGIEPVLQMTCRDRNRIAIAGDLLGASALGVHNVLVLTGDAPSAGDEPNAKAVFDLTSRDVIAMAANMRDQGVVASGRTIGEPPALFVGAADSPFDPPADWEPAGLIAKIDAGARFIQTQLCYEPDIARRYLARLEPFGLTKRAGLLIGLGPIASARSAQWMNEHLYGVNVPAALIGRLEAAADPAEEGRRICAELIDEYRRIPGIAGVHLMAPGQGSRAIADVIDRSGIRAAGTKRP